MDSDSSNVRDELRRSSARDNGHTITGREQTPQQSPMLQGVAPLAGVFAMGRGNGSARVRAMQHAQGTYGNRSVQRFLSSHPRTSNPTPVQRKTPLTPVSDELVKLGAVGGYQGSDSDSEAEQEVQSGGYGAGGPTVPASAPALTSPDLSGVSSTPALFASDEGATSGGYGAGGGPTAVSEPEAKETRPPSSPQLGVPAASPLSLGASSASSLYQVPAREVAPTSPQLITPSSPQLVSSSADDSEELPAGAPAGATLYGRTPSKAGDSAPSPPSPPAPDATVLQAPRPHTDPASGLELMSVIKHFERESEANPNYAGKTATGVTIKTKYLTEQERQPYQVTVGEEGKLYQGGELLETGGETAKTGFRARGSAGGHLYTMSPVGQLYAADQAAEWEKGGMQGPQATVRKELGSFLPSDPDAKSALATPFHHSSFLAGGDVAGAGEMKVHEGVLSMISNASGHYRPGSRQVMQTLGQLQQSGAPIDQARVHLMGDYSPQTGYDASKEVTAAVGEFMAAGGSRGDLLKRHAVTSEIRRAFGVGMQESGPFEGQDMPAPESDETRAGQQEALASLAQRTQRSGFNQSFRTAKGREIEEAKQTAQVEQEEGRTAPGLSYSDFMRRATGRYTGPTAKKPARSPFSFSAPAAPSPSPFSFPAPAPQLSSPDISQAGTPGLGMLYSAGQYPTDAEESSGSAYETREQEASPAPAPSSLPEAAPAPMSAAYMSEEEAQQIRSGLFR